jgi:hypothetical protein
MEDGEDNESHRVLEEALLNVGAIIYQGRHLFGGHPGSRQPTQPWTGWRGNIRPFITRYSCSPTIRACRCA